MMTFLMLTRLAPGTMRSPRELEALEVPTIDVATKISTLVRTYGHATTEVWPALPWAHFKEVVRGLAAPNPVEWDIP